MCNCWVCVGVIEKISLSPWVFSHWTCEGQPVVCSCSCYLQHWGLWDGILGLRFIFCLVPLFKRLVLLSCPAHFSCPTVPSFCLPDWLKVCFTLGCTPENSGKSPSPFSKHSVPGHPAKHFTCIISFNSHKLLRGGYHCYPPFKLRKLRNKEVK